MGERRPSPEEMNGLLVSHMDRNTRKQLSHILEPEILSGNNWTRLAEEMGYTNDEIMAFQGMKDGSHFNSEKLLNDLSVSRTTIQSLWTKLEEISRPDCADVLRDGLPRMRNAYEKENRRCLPSLLLSPNNVPTRVNSASHCNHHLYSAPYGINTGHACHSADHCYNHCGCGHQHSGSVSVGQSWPRGCSSGEASTGSTPSHVCNCPSSAAQQQFSGCYTRGQTISVSGQNYCSPHDSAGKIQNVSVPRPVFQQMTSIEDNVSMCSMEASPAQSHIHVRQDDFAESMVCGTDSHIHSDLPVPVELVLMRRLPQETDGIPSLMPAMDMDVAAEEEVFTSSDSSKSTNSNQGSETKLQYQQNSGGTSWKDSMSVGCQQNSSRNTEKIVNGSVKKTAENGLNQSASANPWGRSNGHQVLFNHPYESMGAKPKAFHNLVPRNGIPVSSDGTKHFMEHSWSGGERDSRSSESSAADRSSHPLRTQPRPRSKINSAPGGIPSLTHTESKQGTPQAVSVQVQHPYKGQGGVTSPGTPPVKQKLSDFNKGKQQVRVFITYALDSPKHCKRVVELSRCLTKNGFLSLFDLPSRECMLEDRLGWYDHNFHTADFVLVCVSPLYKQLTDASSHNSFRAEDADEDLHTKYVYKLMQTEFANNGSRNKRFIPLVFPDASKDHVPNWLQNTLIYRWPHQYKDLLWMLTRPQDRVRRQNSNAH